MKKKLQITYIALFCIYILLMFAACLLKTDGMPDVPNYFLGIPIDKVLHFIMFLPYPFLFANAFTSQKKKVRIELIILLSLLTGAIAAVGTEKLQSLTEYRSSEITDFYADMAGLTFGCIATFIFFKFNNI